MSGILVPVAIQSGKIRKGSLEVLSRCRALAAESGGPFAALIAHPEPNQFVEEVSRYGPERIFIVTEPALDEHRNAPLLSAVKSAAAAMQPALIAMASTEGAKDILGALAIQLDAAVVPDVSSFSFDGSTLTAERPVLAAKFLSNVASESTPCIVSVRSGSYEASESPSQPEVSELTASPSESPAATLREVLTSAAEGVDLNEADVVVAAGRGVKDEAGRDLIHELAETLGAAVGASRAVVENGLFPATAQIGQTGKVVSPDLYIAVGVSGAIQHVAGMLNSRTIIAVNKDPDAPIFEYATYGLVGDLYQILPELTRAFRESRARD